MPLTLKDAKPCPFCGSERFELKEVGGDPAQFVKCSDCDAEGPFEQNDDRESHAVERWNRRAK